MSSRVAPRLAWVVALMASAATLVTSASANAQPAPRDAVEDDGPPTPYYQGRMRIGANAGVAGRGGDTAFFLAASFGVFAVDNLEVGFDAAIWIDDPFFAQVGPGVRYIFPVSRSVHPYVGTFYRHWFIGGGIDDLDGIGVRGGVLISSAPLFFQLGVGYEFIVGGCDGTRDCDDWYPELGIALLL